MSDVKQTKLRIGKFNVKKKTNPLLLGYESKQICDKLKNLECYEELRDEDTEKHIKEIQAKLKDNEFKFSQTFHNQHWCCTIICKNKILVLIQHYKLKEIKTERRVKLQLERVELKLNM